MAYSAIRRGENPPTRKVHRVGIAVSDDLLRWSKCGTEPVNQRDPRYYERLGPATIRIRPMARPVSFLSRAIVSTSTSVPAAKADDRSRPRHGRPGGQQRHADVAGAAAAAGGADRHRDRGAAGLPHRRPLLPGLLLACRLAATLVQAKVPRPPFPRRRLRDGWRVSNRDHLRCMVPARFCRRGKAASLTPSRLVRWQRGWYLLGTVREGRIRCVCDPIPVIADATGNPCRMTGL